MNRTEYVESQKTRCECKGLKEAVKAYLEETQKDDFTLSLNYSEECIDMCIEFINECAASLLERHNGAVSKNLVFKWARDYFIDEIYKEDLTAKEEKEKAAEEMKKRRKEKVYTASVDDVKVKPRLEVEKPKKQAYVSNVTQLDLFGGM